MFLNIIISTVIRGNSYGFIFSAWVQICQIFDATLCSGSIDFVFVD